MLSWIKSVIIKGGHRVGSWWGPSRQDGEGIHLLSEDRKADSPAVLGSLGEPNLADWLPRSDFVVVDIKAPSLEKLDALQNALKQPRN
jgi:hypothetical protein